MSTERERSPSIRSRQLLVKVSQANKRLPHDFFVSKSIAASPTKRPCEAPPESALQKWYDGEDSDGIRQKIKVPARNKQISRVCLLKHHEEQSPVKPSEREKYYHHLLDTMQKKQRIIFRAQKQQKEEKKIKVIERVATGCDQERRSSIVRFIRSEQKGRRTLETPDKQKPKPAREIRLSLKELPRKCTPEGRYHNMNVGFDGLLTFNRFE